MKGFVSITGSVALAAFLASSQAFAQSPCPMTSPPSVLTAQYDQNRSGTNPNETCLSAATWASTGSSYNPSIRVAFPTPAPGVTNSPVYAQPLYVDKLAIGPGGALRQVVIVATLDDYLYAYDANDYTPLTYWGWSLINDLGDCGGSGVGVPIPTAGPGLPRAGIVSTPVIYIPGGTATPTLTVVGGCHRTDNGADFWYLHTLNLLTGQDLGGSGTSIQIGASVVSSDNAAGCTGTGCATLSTTPDLTFNPKYQLQRPALLQVTDGATTEIYIGFGVDAASETHYLTNPYHGWLIGYNPGQSSPSFQFATTPTGPTNNSNSPGCTSVYNVNSQTNLNNLCGLRARIWMGGKGPVRYTIGTTRYVYIGTGNGGFQTGNTNYGSSVLGFSESSTGGPPNSMFTPYSYATLNANDQDMGTSGPLLFTSGSASNLVTFDKTGKGYVLNPASLGGFNAGDTGAVSEFTGGSLTAGGSCDGGAGNGSTACDEITSQVSWTGSSGNTYLFVWPWNEDVDWCLWDTSATNFACYARNTKQAGFPGGTLALSSNGTDMTSAILWAIVLPDTAIAFENYDGDQANYSGYLYALQLKTAPTSSTKGTFAKLWSSTDSWVASKFAIPTIANGRVYVPTYNKGVITYANY